MISEGHFWPCKGCGLVAEIPCPSEPDKRAGAREALLGLAEWIDSQCFTDNEMEYSRVQARDIAAEARRRAAEYEEN